MSKGIDIQIQSPQSALDADFSLQQRREHLGELAEAGVTDFVLSSPPSGAVARTIDALRGYAHDVASLKPAGITRS